MEAIIQTENQILSNISAGEYRNRYLVYARKSTDEPDNQKNSIKYQRAEDTKFAHRERLLVAPVTLKGFSVNGVIAERHSGFKENDDITFTTSGLVQYRIERPKFQRMIQFLSQGAFKGVIVLCWDRISRNRGDDTVVRKLMKKGVDVRFVYANYEKTSAGALHMDIDGMFAEHHSRVTSEKVRITTENLRDRGICTYKAPIGYLNTGVMEHKPLDPVRSPIIKRLFELLAEREWSLSDLTAWANKQGLTSVPARRRRTAEEMLAEEEDEIKIEAVSRPITKTVLHKILTNPFYTGKILGNASAYVPSKSHEALVSEDLFWKAQSALRKKRTSVHYAEKVDLPGRGLVRCAECARVYTPYLQKGIQYFYAQCRPNCRNQRKNFNLAFIQDEIGKCLNGLSFTDTEIEEIDARSTTDIAVIEDTRQKRLEESDRRRRKVREDLFYLTNNKLSLLKSGVFSAEALLAEETKLAAELNALQDGIPENGVSMRDAVKDVIKLSELLKIGSEYYSFANTREKMQIVEIIFSELSLSGNTLKYQCKNGFGALQSRFVSVCDPTVWLSELMQNDKFIKGDIETLQKVLSTREAEGL